VVLVSGSQASSEVEVEETVAEVLVEVGGATVVLVSGSQASSEVEVEETVAEVLVEVGGATVVLLSTPGRHWLYHSLVATHL
jgi:hypothetical protein